MKNFKFLALALLIFAATPMFAADTSPDVDVGIDQHSYTVEQFSTPILEINLIAITPDFQASVFVTQEKVSPVMVEALSSWIATGDSLTEDHYRYRQKPKTETYNPRANEDHGDLHTIPDFHRTKVTLCQPLLC